MNLFSILVLAYILLIVASDFATWCYGKAINKRLGNYDTDDLPKPVYRKVVSLQKAKRTTSRVIRVLQILLLIPIVSALVTGIGLLIINF